jgi:hypothetical protein
MSYGIRVAIRIFLFGMKVHGEREVMVAAGSLVALALHLLVLALEELRCGGIAICNAHQQLKHYDKKKQPLCRDFRKTPSRGDFRAGSRHTICIIISNNVHNCVKELVDKRRGVE